MNSKINTVISFKYVCFEYSTYFQTTQFKRIYWRDESSNGAENKTCPQTNYHHNNFVIIFFLPWIELHWVIMYSLRGNALCSDSNLGFYLYFWKALSESFRILIGWFWKRSTTTQYFLSFICFSPLDCGRARASISVEQIDPTNLIRMTSTYLTGLFCWTNMWRGGKHQNRIYIFKTQQYRICILFARDYMWIRVLKDILLNLRTGIMLVVINTGDVSVFFCYTIFFLIYKVLRWKWSYKSFLFFKSFHSNFWILFSKSSHFQYVSVHFDYGRAGT